MTLRLYNTLTRRLEEFAPLKPPAVTMYVCGPTVYDDPHIGHARSAYIFDVLRRYLAYKNFHVTFVRNVTDVDDKIIGKAREESGVGDLKAKCREVAERHLDSYHGVLERLGIPPPDHEPKATEHVIPDSKNVEATKKIDASMTGFISQLITKNVAYAAGGDVYFSVRKFPGYGKLSNRTVDELKSGARVEPGEHKEDPLDFALWKAAKPDEPSWNSPWGPGRPGWHIECSVMSTAYLGDGFDIHGGGVDLVFPHHENEIAQAQALDKPFAKYWIHNGLLTVNGEKMSKSLNNYITMEQVLEHYPEPTCLKLFFLKTHYRSPIDYSAVRMDEAKKNYAEFERFFAHYYQLMEQQVASRDGTLSEQEREEINSRQKVFEAAMDDDLNTPKALAVLFDLVNLGQSSSSRSLPKASAIYQTLIRCGTTLGLFVHRLSQPSELFQHVTAVLTTHESERKALIEKRIQERDAARKQGDFKRADEIRKALLDLGAVLTDTPEGTLWHEA